MIQPTTIRQSSRLRAGIIGLAVGDALGVPVEFQSRGSLDRQPVTGMRSRGSHNQPAGTWSDDTSLALCLVESLCERGMDYDDQARRFIGWLMHEEWTPHGEVFDVGNATSEAIRRLDDGVEPLEAGRVDEHSCGNGSLMRILPIALYMAYAEPSQRIRTAMDCSRLTHGHVRCQLACALYVEVAVELLLGRPVADAVASAQARLQPWFVAHFPQELDTFNCVLSSSLECLDRDMVSGQGYVIDTLTASLWCALRAEDYSHGVLAAVNLGDDTDTTGAVTGALLGLRFGVEGIPPEWIDMLARKSDVLALVDRFEQVCQQRWTENVS